jgi:hypothetical protein
MENVLTLEIKSLSRWAYANVTFVLVDQYRIQPDRQYDRRPAHLTAAVCSLYLCLRTYTASITDNKLVKKEVDRQVIKIDLFQAARGPPSLSDIRGSGWVWSNSYHLRRHIFGNFTAVKSPCRVAGKLLDVSTNMSSHPGLTKLALYDFIHDDDEGFASSHDYKAQNITAPEQCIYRHDPLLVRSISTILHDVFNGECRLLAPGLVANSCYAAYGQKEAHNTTRSQMTDIGMNTVIRTFYNNGNANYANISRWFEDFADGMMLHANRVIPTLSHSSHIYSSLRS